MTGMQLVVNITLRQVGASLTWMHLLDAGDIMRFWGNAAASKAVGEDEIGTAPSAEAGPRVRLFEERDIEKAREILRQHLATTVFREQAFSDAKADRHFATVLSRPNGMLGVVAMWNGVPSGLAWAQADTFMLTDGPPFVSVNLIAVDLRLGPVRRAKVFLALVAAIRKWAASIGASHSFIHVTTGSNLASTDRLMKAAGAKSIGGAYVVWFHQAEKKIINDIRGKDIFCVYDKNNVLIRKKVRNNSVVYINTYLVDRFFSLCSYMWVAKYVHDDF
jgi:hypothetical protein